MLILLPISHHSMPTLTHFVPTKWRQLPLPVMDWWPWCTQTQAQLLLDMETSNRRDSERVKQVKDDDGLMDVFFLIDLDICLGCFLSEDSSHAGVKIQLWHSLGRGGAQDDNHKGSRQVGNTHDDSGTVQELLTKFLNKFKPISNKAVCIFSSCKTVGNPAKVPWHPGDTLTNAVQQRSAATRDATQTGYNSPTWRSEGTVYVFTANLIHNVYKQI